MKIAPHRAFDELRKRMADRPELLRPWRGIAYRATTLAYADPADILRGEGSYRYGGRWNAIGSFRAVYGSVEDSVAVTESRANADYARVPFPLVTPRLLVAVELSLQSVIDLTSMQTRRILNITLEELRREDWRKVQEQDAESFTQAIGRAAFANNAEGTLVPSARMEQAVNVAYFPENLRPHSEVKVLESERLNEFNRLLK